MHRCQAGTSPRFRLEKRRLGSVVQQSARGCTDSMIFILSAPSSACAFGAGINLNDAGFVRPAAPRQTGRSRLPPLTETGRSAAPSAYADTCGFLQLRRPVTLEQDMRNTPIPALGFHPEQGIAHVGSADRRTLRRSCKAICPGVARISLRPLSGEDSLKESDGQAATNSRQTSNRTR